MSVFTLDIFQQFRYFFIQALLYAGGKMGRVNNTPKQLRVAQQRLRQRVISFLGARATTGFRREDLLAGQNAPFNTVHQAGQFLAGEQGKHRAQIADPSTRMWKIIDPVQQNTVQQETRMLEVTQPPPRRQPTPRVSDLSTIRDLFLVIQYLGLRAGDSFTAQSLRTHLGTKLVGVERFPFVNTKEAMERLDAIAKRSDLLERTGDGEWKIVSLPAEWQAELDTPKAEPRTTFKPRAAAMGDKIMTAATTDTTAATESAIQTATPPAQLHSADTTLELWERRKHWLHEQFGEEWFSAAHVVQKINTTDSDLFRHRTDWNNFASRYKGMRWFMVNNDADGYPQYRIVLEREAKGAQQPPARIPPPVPPAVPSPAVVPQPAPMPDDSAAQMRIKALETRVAQLENTVNSLTRQIAPLAALRTALRALVAVDTDKPY
jgi:hypothetical protein